MSELSFSPERRTFQRNVYINQQTEKGLLDSPETQQMIAWYDKNAAEYAEREQDPEWQKDNLEYVLRTTDWILEKVRGSEDYARALYAAMCNTDFIKNDVWPILTDKTWSCSWRYAGGIIADMIGKGDYIDWYCSGNEGIVTDEVRDDLLKLGWIVKEFNDGF